MSMKPSRKRRRSERAASDEEGSGAEAPSSSFAAGALQRAGGPAASRFSSATPFAHVQLADLFEPSALHAVRTELAQLQSTFKETDLFKVYQTGDLANLDAANAQHTAALPATLALRSALYSEPFRAFVRSVTGCAPLTAQQDCSVNAYRRGGHLLCHDDVIGTRCVSYILYLSRPDKPWRPKLGGALELYSVSRTTGAVDPSPVHQLAPEFGTLVLFTVQPGISFHSVQEVGSKEARLSISGWFHAAHPPDGADTTATLAQLEGGGGGAALERPRARPVKPPRPRRSLTSAQEQRLAAIVNPAYLQAATISAVREQLREHGAALLAGFLQPRVVATILHATAAADRRDGLDGACIPSGGPPYAAGMQRKGWRLEGPPQLRRYVRYRRRRRPADDASASESAQPQGGDRAAAHRAAPASSLTSTDAEPSAPSAARASAGEALDEIRAMMHSAPFVQLMGALSGLTPEACATEIRRFRPGLDYTLAHVGTRAARPTLDATLCFVGSDSAAQRALWESGDVGGFECHVQSSKEDEHGAAEVYRADDASAGVTSIHAQANALSIVARDTDAMKFIKFVSAAAPGSRWDVAAEYTCTSG